MNDMTDDKDKARAERMHSDIIIKGSCIIEIERFNKLFNEQFCTLLMNG